jgi:hypothetical protein
VSGLGVRLRLCVSRPTKLLDPPVQSPSLRLAHAKDRVVEGARGRRHFGSTYFGRLTPRVRLSRPPSASTPRSSASAHGLPSPGEHRDLRTVPGSWAAGESRGLDSDARAGAPTAAPFPPPAPAGSVRCWRRAGLPRAVVRVCKEKCAIPDLEESVALNSLDPIAREALRPCLLLITVGVLGCESDPLIL